MRPGRLGPRRLRPRDRGHPGVPPDPVRVPRPGGRGLWRRGRRRDRPAHQLPRPLTASAPARAHRRSLPTGRAGARRRGTCGGSPLHAGRRPRRARRRPGAGHPARRLPDGLFPMGVGEPGSQPARLVVPERCAGVLPPGALRVSRSLRKACPRFEVRVDTALRRGHRPVRRPGPAGRVDQRRDPRGLPRLHELGWVHSVETWQDGRLVGGLYGVCVGRPVRGGVDVPQRDRRLQGRPSSALVDRFFADGDPRRLIDAQWPTEHLVSLGVGSWPRRRLPGSPCATPWPRPRSTSGRGTGRTASRGPASAASGRQRRPGPERPRRRCRARGTAGRRPPRGPAHGPHGQGSPACCPAAAAPARGRRGP